VSIARRPAPSSSPASTRTRTDRPDMTTHRPAARTSTRMPSRRSLRPALPVDVQALVKAGHLVPVSDGVYRRAPHPTAATTPTPRQQHDHHVDCIVAAVLDRAADAALAAHVAARALLDRHSGPRPNRANTVAHSNGTAAAMTTAPSTTTTAPTATDTSTLDDRDRDRRERAAATHPHPQPPGRAARAPVSEPLWHSRSDHTRAHPEAVSRTRGRRGERPGNDPCPVVPRGRTPPSLALRFSTSTPTADDLGGAA